MPQQHIGSVINPGWAYDLESSLKLQRMLAERARADVWRFRGYYVTTGPYETMMGHANCGSGHNTHSTIDLDLPFILKLDGMVRAVNTGILRAMCQYPEFAEMAELTWRAPFPDSHCGEAVKRLAEFEGRKATRQLNPYWKRAKVIRDVRLVCDWSGIYFAANVSFNLKRCESRWSVFQLLREPLPRWNERGRVAKWLVKCADMLEEIIEGEA